MAAGIVYSPRNSIVIMYAFSFTFGHKGILYSFILVFAIKASLLLCLTYVCCLLIFLLLSGYPALWYALTKLRIPEA
jgi:predicted neutral ceramidase superfamily lipid hydrolase